MNGNILTLNIESDAFKNMRGDFDKVLKRTLGNMQVKESDEATLTLKISIKLEEVTVPDFDSDVQDAVKKVHKPRFDHKCSSVMQIKTEESGSFKGEYELVWDEDAQDFVMKPIDNGQGSLFDGEDGNVIQADYVEVDESPDALPDVKPKLMPPAEEDFDDYEYEEETI